MEDVTNFVGMFFMDGTGDTKISWKAKDDEKILPAIQRLMDKGYVFWHVELTNEGDVVLEKPVTGLGTLRQRSLIVQDEALAQLYKDGTLQVVSGLWAKAACIVKAFTNAPEVIKFASAARRSVPATRATAAVTKPEIEMLPPERRPARAIAPSGPRSGIMVGAPLVGG